MNVIIRAYDLPDSNASGLTAHAVARFLTFYGDQGHVSTEAMTLATVRGWTPDVVLGQQWATDEASYWATELHVPFVMMVYGPGQFEQFMPQCDLVIFPSADLRDAAGVALGCTPTAVLPGIYAREEDVAQNRDWTVQVSDAVALRNSLHRLVSAGRRRATVSLCMTVANEAETLEQAILSVAPVVDAMIIGVDERSSDGTAEIAQHHADTYFTYLESSPPDFRRMRNRAMERVATDWALVLDGHEWIENAEAIRSAIESTAWSIEIKTMYEPDQNRIPSAAFPFPRLHRRHVRFVGPAAHEEVSTPLEKRGRRLDILVWHERKPGRAATDRVAEKQGSELEVLRTAWEQHGDRRALFYYGCGLRDAGMFAEAVRVFEQYLEAPSWPQEGWLARLYLARCYLLLEDWVPAKREAERAVLESPERAEGPFMLGHIHIGIGDYVAAAAWFRMAACLPEPTVSLVCVEMPIYTWASWHGLALALDRLEDYPGAIRAEQQAVAGGAASWALENIAVWQQKLAGRE